MLIMHIKEFFVTNYVLLFHSSAVKIGKPLEMAEKRKGKDSNRD